MVVCRKQFERKRVQVKCGGNMLTEQSHENETNINQIIARARKTGYIPQAAGNPMYGDFSSAEDYMDSQNKLQEAKDNFMRLPADIRARFKNNPAVLLNFLNDEKNYEEAAKLGLVQRKAVIEEPIIPETPVTPETPIK